MSVLPTPGNPPQQTCSPVSPSDSLSELSTEDPPSLVQGDSASSFPPVLPEAPLPPTWPEAQFGSLFWQRLPGFAQVSREEFRDFRFQLRRSVRSPDELARVLGNLVSSSFLEQLTAGLADATMRMQVTPYILSVIDWDHPEQDPVRRQFLPLSGENLPDHPFSTLDSLHELTHSPVPGLVHRYPDKVLLLSLDVCPVYCRFCTRSYAVGGDTPKVAKSSYQPASEKWARAVEYIRANPQVKDVVVSGGDTSLLPGRRLRALGEALLAIPHVRRIRFASKVLSVFPMKIMTDHEWTDSLLDLARQGRRLGKSVALHTHVNSGQEVSSFSHEAMRYLFAEGLTVRNQSVLMRGVNDTLPAQKRLLQCLDEMNVQPYYVYVHDFVPGIEHLRTSLGQALELERELRGSTAGFLMPTFVCDLPGGGGKRNAHSFDLYDRELGISIFRSPALDSQGIFLFFDPLDQLPETGRQRWRQAKDPADLVHEVVRRAGLEDAPIRFPEPLQLEPVLHS